MNKGFTTGSCAAAASKAAAYMLLSGKTINSIKIGTPAGIDYETELLDIVKCNTSVSCAVKKYSGDDPDITNGVKVYATVQMLDTPGKLVSIRGGEGVGRVTRPGLDQPVGEWAINSTPRSMIEHEVREVTELFDYEGSFEVVISVPEGVEIAKKTFNPRLGIEGGISIIGTSGIVEPMSVKALKDTIRLELNQLKVEKGVDIAVISPGNYGLAFMREHYDYDLDKAVKCSNFIGDTIDIARELGFKELLLCGHIGKLVKVSGGIMNTHSSEADCRMELLAAAAAKCGAENELICTILDCVTTEEAYEHMKSAGIERECMDYVMNRIAYYLSKRAGEDMRIECIMYSNSEGLLGETAGASAMLNKASEE